MDTKRIRVLRAFSKTGTDGKSHPFKAGQVRDFPAESVQKLIDCGYAKEYKVPLETKPAAEIETKAEKPKAKRKSKATKDA